MRLIDADYALAALVLGETESGGLFETDSSCMKDFLKALPTIDAVTVVRCKDCQKFDPDEIIAPETGTCWQYEVVKDFNGFCDYGK